MNCLDLFDRMNCLDLLVDLLVEFFLELPPRTTPLEIKHFSNSLIKTQEWPWKIYFLALPIHKTLCLVYPHKYLNSHFLVSRKIAKLWSLLYYINLLSSKIIEPFNLNHKPSFVLSYNSKILKDLVKILSFQNLARITFDHGNTKGFLKYILFRHKYLPNGLPLLYVTLLFYKIFYMQFWFPRENEMIHMLFYFNHGSLYSSKNPLSFQKFSSKPMFVANQIKAIATKIKLGLFDLWSNIHGIIFAIITYLSIQITTPSSHDLGRWSFVQKKMINLHSASLSFQDHPSLC
jgi:hypothetical protein